MLREFFKKFCNCTNEHSNAEKNIDNQKHVEYYSQSVNAWYLTALERDKSILTIASGGIALLVSLMTTSGINSYLVFYFYIISIIFFLISIITIIMILNENKKDIENVINNTGENECDFINKDKLAFWTFILGIIFTMLIGIISAYESLKKKEIEMSKDTNKSTQSSNESFKGNTNIQPSSSGSGNTSNNSNGNSTTSNVPKK